MVATPQRTSSGLSGPFEHAGDDELPLAALATAVPAATGDREAAAVRPDDAAGDDRAVVLVAAALDAVDLARLAVVAGRRQRRRGDERGEHRDREQQALDDPHQPSRSVTFVITRLPADLTSDRSR